MSLLAVEIVRALKEEPLFFSRILRMFRQHTYREVLLAWSELRETGSLERTRPEGGYYWKG